MKWLKKHYDNFSVSEIINAIERGAVDNVDHFGSFDITYLGKVLNNYISYRNHCLSEERHAMDAESKKAEELEREQRLKDRKPDEDYEFCKDQVIKHKTIDLPAPWVNAFNWAKNNIEGFAYDPVNITERVEEDIKNRSESKGLPSQARNFIDSEMKSNNFTHLCKTMAIKDHMKTFIYGKDLGSKDSKT